MGSQGNGQKYFKSKGQLSGLAQAPRKTEGAAEEDGGQQPQPVARGTGFDVLSSLGLALFLCIIGALVNYLPIVDTVPVALCTTAQYRGHSIAYPFSRSQKGVLVVTGGAGYVGSHTVLALSKDTEIMSEFELIVLDNLESGHVESVPSGCKFVKLDLGDTAEVLSFFLLHKPLAVIDFAAYLAVEQSQRHPEEYMRNNIVNFMNLIHGMLAAGSKYLIKSSTQATYGDVREEDMPVPESYTFTNKPAGISMSDGHWSDAPVDGSTLFNSFIQYYQRNVSSLISKYVDMRLSEDDVFLLQTPMSIYGLSKLLNEIMMAKVEEKGIMWTSLRYGNVCGADPSGKIGEAKPKPHTLMTLAIYALLSQPGGPMEGMGFRSTLNVYGTDYPTRDGTAIRDYVHPSDLADAHIKALKRLKRGEPSDTFNLGTSTGSTVFEVLTAVERAANMKLPTVHKPRRPGDTPMSILDTSKALRMLNWTAESTLDDMARTAWTWHKSRPYINPYKGE
mmetsp:Transcript_415/g.1454  ORF Transcript_415/g.1454 Transcript_415/m.1454 type:complete len:505 (-) Transcript_415:1626-3140(-)